MRCHDFLPRQELESRLAKAVDSPVHALRFGPELCQYIAIVSGGAGSEIASLAAEGVDTIITGEGPHWTFALAQELQLNVLYGGHYATETFGVKALAHQLSQHFQLPWTFIHQPSGL
ncbi:MAG: Nif3-like dinuclear metal center hexameric protein [Verrucomicrobia bacterium]|nr:Nif3-like dinuclear metal center hexameric protein [Verrucomicrobiota bacterium]